MPDDYHPASGKAMAVIEVVAEGRVEAVVGKMAKAVVAQEGPKVIKAVMEARLMGEESAIVMESEPVLVKPWM
jgi:hypothetical protein